MGGHDFGLAKSASLLYMMFPCLSREIFSFFSFFGNPEK